MNIKGYYMKRRIILVVNMLFSLLVFLGLLYYVVNGQKWEYPSSPYYEACDIRTTTTEDIDLSYEIYRRRVDGNITRNVELVIPANTSVHICGVFSNGTVEIDDIGMDIELDQEIIELLQDYPHRWRGGAFNKTGSLYETSLFWGKISVNQLDSDELTKMHRRLAFKPDHIDDFWNISTIVAIALFAVSSFFITKNERVPLAIKIIIPWIMSLIIVVLHHVTFYIIYMWDL